MRKNLIQVSNFNNRREMKVLEGNVGFNIFLAHPPLTPLSSKHSQATGDSSFTIWSKKVMGEDKGREGGGQGVRSLLAEVLLRC